MGIQPTEYTKKLLIAHELYLKKALKNKVMQSKLVTYTDYEASKPGNQENVVISRDNNSIYYLLNVHIVPKSVQKHCMYFISLVLKITHWIVIFYSYCTE